MTLLHRATRHPSYPWLAWPIGLGLLGLGSVLLYRDHAADRTHLIVYGLVALVGLFAIPGVAAVVASSISVVGRALFPFLPWRAQLPPLPPTNADGSDTECDQ